MKTIGIAKFKAQCLSLLERLSPEGLIITKRGKAVAQVLPYPQRPADLIGSLRDKIVVHSDLLSTGASWNADAES